jgi:uncharacterized membrane protein
MFGKLCLAEVSPIPATLARAIVMAAVTSLAAIATADVKELAGMDRGLRTWPP